MGKCVESAGSRSRWVGPQVVPQPERGNSTGERQRLPGGSQQVHVNDVVEVLPKDNNPGNSEKGFLRLSQVGRWTVLN